MTDIFDTTILCKSCKKEMVPIIINKNGFELRAVQCPECKDQIVHPADINGYRSYNDLKNKDFNVKLRIVGNSHTVSIPKEIVNFIKQQEKIMDDMVRLHFDDMRRISLFFGDHEENNQEKENKKFRRIN